MITSVQVKEIVKNLGADLCGIAPVERFEGAPPGYHPRDIYKDCKSVIVFAKRVPTSSLYADSCVPYTFINNLLTQEVDLLTAAVSTALEDCGVVAVPVPSDDPYEFWVQESSYGRAILSLRHAGSFAGLGTLGKNTLLINERFGNMIQLGAVLVDIELEGDPIATYPACLPNCRICLDACPANCLNGNTVNQELCRPLSNYKNKKGYVLKKCNICRKICPHHAGIK